MRATALPEGGEHGGELGGVDRAVAVLVVLREARARLSLARLRLFDEVYSVLSLHACGEEGIMDASMDGLECS